MGQTIDGGAVAWGHAPLMRMLLDASDRDTKIVSKGDRYYNASDFPLLTFMLLFFKTSRSAAPTLEEVRQEWSRARHSVSKDKEIVIGATPARLTREILAGQARRRAGARGLAQPVHRAGLRD